MRYRFSATTRDGEVRAGVLEAEDEAGAGRQLERRGLTLQSLTEDTSDVPVHVKTDMGAITAKMPLLATSRKMNWPDWRAVDWRALNWRRIGLAGLVSLLLLCGIAWGVSRALADKVYTMRLSGDVHLITNRKLGPDYWKRIYPRLWLPRPGWFINSRGTIFAKGSNGRWGALGRRAKVTYHAEVEGNYTIEILVKLPSAPEGCSLSFTTRGCKRVSKRGMFQPRNGVYECQIPAISLVPTRRPRTRKSGPKAKP